MKRRLKISLVLPTTYMLRLRPMVEGLITPAGGKGEHDVFVMQDIGRRNPAAIVKNYERENLHVVHMMPIPNWEGAPQ